MKIATTLLALLLVFPKIGNTQNPTKVDIPGLIEIFKTRSIEKEKIDWGVFEKEVLEAAKISRKAAIKKALTLNGNPHSFFIKGQNRLFGDYSGKPVSNRKRKSCYFDQGPLFEDNPRIGYIRVDGLGLNPNDGEQENNEKSKAYVDQILEAIKTQDSSDLDAWVIDLRFNGGGNMWPMLIALTPFFKEGDLGYFIYGDYKYSWSMKGQQIYAGRQVQNLEIQL